MKKLFKSALLRWTLLLLVFGLSGTALASDASSSVLVGYGQSFPGLGDTTEKVRALEVLYRYRHVMHARVGPRWLEGNHELWLEFPASFILSNRDDRDVHTVGMVGINFLFAWLFTGTEWGRPYVILGGGPRYVFADIEGFGSKTPGNYQAGLGYRFPGPRNTVMTFDIRYVHVSNLGFADPNVPLNSVVGYWGLSF